MGPYSRRRVRGLDKHLLINESFFLDIAGLLSHKADINGHVW
jgi:hypothetical protein